MATKSKKVRGKQTPKLTIETYKHGMGDHKWQAIYRGKVVAKSEEGYATAALALAAWDRFFDRVTKGNIYLEIDDAG
jgi:hypothetical protein